MTRGNTDMTAENCKEKDDNREKYKSNYRLIEVAFPVDAVSKSGSHERYLQGCTPHSLHVWWARRPFSAMRAIVFSSLAPAPSQQAGLADLLTLTDEISASADPPPLFMNAARDIVLQSHGGRPPLVLDMFGGGGTIALEAARLGCRAFSLDINPLAYFIQRTLLQYSQAHPSLVELIRE
jgi:putative DNA methylase